MLLCVGLPGTSTITSSVRIWPMQTGAKFGRVFVTCIKVILEDTCYMESSLFSWERAGPATARGAEPYRSQLSFAIGGPRQLAARSGSETVPFGSDTGRPQCRNRPLPSV